MEVPGSSPGKPTLLTPEKIVFQAPEGELLTGGNIMDEHDLGHLYHDVSPEELVDRIDPTVVKSTLYYAMLHFGVLPQTALKRAENVYISDNGECGPLSGACVFIHPTFPVVLERGHVTGIPRSGLLRVLAHEAYHQSALEVIEERAVEDHGVLGVYINEHPSLGFSGDNRFDGLVKELIIREHTKKGEKKTFSAPEEFFAEFGSLRYSESLLNQALDNYGVKAWILSM